LACPPNPVRRTMSDDRGRFDLTNLPPGNCTLRGTKAGYVDDSAEGDPGVEGQYALKVVEGIWRDGFELRLAQGVIVSGRVIDERGRPAGGVRVHPIRRRAMNGISRINPVAYQLTNPAGTFEFANLPPGEYYFGASPRPEGRVAALQVAMPSPTSREPPNLRKRNPLSCSQINRQVCTSRSSTR
jgi:hypothetical protein